MGWKEYLKGRGFTVENSMQQSIETWWQWYTATHPWYSSEATAGSKTFKVERITAKPARMVCQEAASLILNERTGVSADQPKANEWLERYLDETRFMMNSQGLVERSYAVGTGAWALRMENVTPGVPSENARIVTQRFDARHIVPLTYDEDTCTECAFISKVTARGKSYEQIQLYLLGEDKTYEIETVFLNTEGRQVTLEGFIEEPFKTRSKVPLFALVRPGLENTTSDFSPFGVSLFDDAIGAVKLVDESFDMIHNDMYLGQRMLFIDSSLLEDASGKVVIPRAADQQLFRKVDAPTGSGKLVEEYAPDLRISELRTALTTSLEVLGTRIGFGAEYFSLDGDGGIKTATEVVADNSDLFRTIRKHENELAPAIQTIVAGILTLAREHLGADIEEDFGVITVTFDDSVIEDTEAQRKRDRADVAAGLMAVWEYRAKWYGEDEETAKAFEAALGGMLPPEE